MSQWNDPGKLEEAMAAVVSGLSFSMFEGDSPATAVAINTGQDDDELRLPSVTCAVAGAGQEVVKSAGIWRTPAVVRVTSSANLTLAQHRSRAGAVFDAFLQTDIAAILSAALADFHCYDVFPQSPEPTRKDPREDESGGRSYTFVTEMTMEVVWCGSDIV